MRATLSLPAEVGMTVNAAKSRIVGRFEGSEAKRWLKAHLQHTAQGPVLCLGTRSHPINIPSVQSVTYLGVEASFAGIEMQT